MGSFTQISNSTLRTAKPLYNRDEQQQRAPSSGVKATVIARIVQSSLLLLTAWCVNIQPTAEDFRAEYLYPSSSHDEADLT